MKLTLYIAGIAADLSDDTLIQMNYTAEELTDPVAVKNSYSQSVTLPRTKTNDALFGHIYRHDRLTIAGGGVGVRFAPHKKTEFAIYNDRSEILECGYIRLDSITAEGYSITLYGGLGAFLYDLMYDTAGNKMTLASIDYLGGGANELNFAITKGNVRIAWRKLCGLQSGSDIFGVVNFAPCYNGAPEGEFDADKQIVPKEAMIGVNWTTDTGDYLPMPSGSGGFVLMKASRKMDEWEAHDLRSYLQRPAVKVSAVLQAIFDLATAGGWAVYADNTFFTSSNPNYYDTWMTLPMLTKVAASDDSATNTSSGTMVAGSGNHYQYEAIWSNPSTIGSREDSVKVTLTPQFSGGGSTSGIGSWQRSGRWQNNHFLQIVGLDAGGSVVAASPIVSYGATVYGKGAGNWLRMYDTANMCNGFVFTNAKEGASYVCRPYFVGDDTVRLIGNNGGDTTQKTLTIEMTGRNIKSVRLVWESVDHTAMLVSPYDPSNANKAQYNNIETELGLNLGWSLTCNSRGASVRSGSVVTKDMLLGSTMSPAEFLLSYCKTFGLVLVFNQATKAVTIKQRSTFYAGGAKVDINSRIDRGREVTSVPFVFSSRWYRFGSEVSGKYAEEYEGRYGRVYGDKRINTGYEFNADERSLTDSVKFRGACDATKKAVEMCDVTGYDSQYTGISLPPILLEGGCKMTIWSGEDTKDFDCPTPKSDATIGYWSQYKGYDRYHRVQFHGDGLKAEDGSGVLLYYCGKGTQNKYEHTYLTDDEYLALRANDGVPCYDFRPTTNYKVADVYAVGSNVPLPLFSRFYDTGGIGFNLARGLEFGTPAEVDIAGAVFSGSFADIVDKRWLSYLSDRYDVDSRVVTAWVDLSGMQVGQALLANFYTFDGCVWVLNRIINHSLTTDGCTQCEFVKVKDMSNYTSKQAL